MMRSLPCVKSLHGPCPGVDSEAHITREPSGSIASQPNTGTNRRRHSRAARSLPTEREEQGRTRGQGTMLPSGTRVGRCFWRT